MVTDRARRHAVRDHIRCVSDMEVIPCWLRMTKDYVPCPEPALCAADRGIYRSVSLIVSNLRLLIRFLVCFFLCL